MKNKKVFADELATVSNTMKNVIAMFKRTKPDHQANFLESYCEYKYMSLVGCLHKLVEHFYRTKNIRAVTTITEAIKKFTKTDHIDISYNGGNSFHVNSSLVATGCIPLNSQNLLYGFYNNTEAVLFDRAVRPVVNEKAQEPPQITLFQSLYQTDPLRKMSCTQFAGQFVRSHNSVPFSALETALLELPMSDRKYCQAYIESMKYQEVDYMETVTGESGLSEMASDEVYSYL
jgi:hypothetical protein